jgi:TetR/AcrR family transcriptional repressor of nem operon
MVTSTVELILDIAESQVRAGGYNSFSFREISKEIGIKSASIHYHFPTKADLAVALASRYTDKFLAKLQAIQDETTDVKQRLSRYIALFRHALAVDKKMCLCGQLASESDVLPLPVQQQARRFFAENLSWLSVNLFTEDSRGKAAIVLASLEGALIISKAMGGNESFDEVSSELAKLLG